MGCQKSRMLPTKICILIVWRILTEQLHQKLTPRQLIGHYWRKTISVLCGNRQFFPQVVNLTLSLSGGAKDYKVLPHHIWHRCQTLISTAFSVWSTVQPIVRHW